MSKTVLIYGAILLVILFYLWSCQSNKQQSESFTPNITKVVSSSTPYLYPNVVNNLNSVPNSGSRQNKKQFDPEPVNIIANEEIDDNEEVNDVETIENQRLIRKMEPVDMAKPGKYKMVNYKDGVRGSTGMSKELENNFDNSNELIQDDYSENDKYTGFDEASDKYASYSGEKKKTNKYKLDEIFNSDEYLPNYKRDDWYEVLPEAISAKNRHLINVSKPIGINTIGTSLRNPSWDIRGSPPCPKFVVAPWLQSTIEQDTNLKSLC